jgi:5'(3')-deoxyribonucleotidase
MIIGSDIDDTILSLIPRWIKAYNREFGDNLKPKDITDWDIARFVLPEAKEEIFKYIEAEDIFENAKPIEGAFKVFRTPDYLYKC